MKTWGGITWDPDETFPEGTLLLTDTDTARLIRGRKALLEHVRAGLLPGVIVEGIGHGDGGQERERTPGDLAG